MQARRIAGLLLRVLACAHSLPLTTPSPASGHRRGALTAQAELSQLTFKLSTAGAAAPPPPSHTIDVLMPVACNAEHAIQWGAPAQRGGPNGWSLARSLLQARASGAPRPTPHAPASVTRTPPQTSQAPNSTRGAQEEAQCGTCVSGALCPSAPFRKPRPPAESPLTALPRRHCLMLQWHAFTFIRPCQKQRNHLCH